LSRFPLKIRLKGVATPHPEPGARTVHAGPRCDPRVHDINVRTERRDAMDAIPAPREIQVEY